MKPFPPRNHFKTFFGYFLSEKDNAYNENNWSLVELTEKINAFKENAENAYSLGDLYLMRGGMLKAAGCYKEAFADFKSACEETNHCKDIFDAKLECATFHTLLGENEEADALFKDLLDNGAKMSPNPNWINFYAKYSTSLVSSDQKAAMDLATKAAELYPNDPDIHLARGSVAYMCHNPTEAIAVCVTAFPER